MKKVFSFIMGLVAMTSLQAANTEVARLTLTGQGGTEASYITLRVDPTVTTAQTGAYFENTDLTGNVNIYVLDGATKLSSYKKDDLTNLHLGIITNRRDAADQHYTITFNVPTSTVGLKLYDLAVVPTTPIDITNGDTYEFEVNTTLHPDFVAGTNYTINDRFIINYVAPATGYTVTPNAAGYATFSAAEATVIPTGATAYTGTISGEELVLNQIMGGYVPANTGVIVAGVAGTPYNFAIYDGSVDAIAGNALKATATYETSMKNVYVLKGNAFLEYVGTNALAANKAYIQLPAGPNNAPARISMRFNEPQDVENAEAESVKAEKFVENGQVLIRRGNEVYNLQGQIVQ